MRWMLIVAMLVGCSDGNPSAEIRARAAELSSGYKQQAQVIVAKQDQALATLTEVHGRVGDLLLAADDTKQRLELLEASLVKSEPQREEVIKSALEPQEVAKANPSQSSQPVASPPAVRSSGPLKLSWNVEGNWSPSILETAKHLREDHGIIADGMTHQQMHDAHAAAHEGRKVANKSQPVQMINRGSSCPGGQRFDPQIERLRPFNAIGFASYDSFNGVSQSRLALHIDRFDKAHRRRPNKPRRGVGH